MIFLSTPCPSSQPSETVSLSLADVHVCNSIACSACNHPEKYVKFVKTIEKGIKQVATRGDQQLHNRDCDKTMNRSKCEWSQASTAPSSPSTSRNTLMPSKPITGNQIVLFERFSSIGIIRAYSSRTNRKEREDDIAKPYEMTRSRTFSDDESLNLFIENIESIDRCDGEDVDNLMFGNPWKPLSTPVQAKTES